MARIYTLFRIEMQHTHKIIKTQGKKRNIITGTGILSVPSPQKKMQITYKTEKVKFGAYFCHIFAHFVAFCRDRRHRPLMAPLQGERHSEQATHEPSGRRASCGLQDGSIVSLDGRKF